MTAKHSVLLNIPIQLFEMMDLLCQIQHITKTDFILEAIKRQLDMYRSSDQEDLVAEHLKANPFYDWCKAYFAFVEHPEDSVLFTQYKALNFQMEQWAKEYDRLKGQDKN